MATILGLYQRVERLDIDKAIDIAFSNNTDSFVEAQKTQLFDGYTKTGEKIGLTESPLDGTLNLYKWRSYSAMKNAKNPKPGLGFPDLKLTGRFYGGIKADYANFTLKIYSTDEKSEKLTAKYPGIWGLGPGYKLTWIDQHLEPELHKQITAQIGLKFSNNA